MTEELRRQAERAARVVLTNRDREQFLAALDRPARPIPDSLRRAKERRADTSAKPRPSPAPD